jgi:hypothetical protein
MNPYRWIALAAIGAGLLGGCSAPTPGTTRPMGSVGYEVAFTAAKEILSQHFSLLRSDPEKGIIECRPQSTEARPEGLLGGSTPARRVATLRLRREGNDVTAHLAVAVQQQQSDVYRQMRMPEDIYDSVPNKSPAEMGAEATGEQKEVWQTRRYDEALQRQILAELYRALHPVGEE